MRIWPIVIAMVAASLCSLLAGGFGVEPRGLALVVFTSLGCEALAFVYRTRRPEPRIAAALSAVAQVVAVSAAAGAMSYAVAARGGPLWDRTFAAWDAALGLDWRAYAGFVDRAPALAWAERTAYDSLALQLLFTLVALGFSGRLRALRTFTAAFALAAFATVLISGLVPALGAFPGLGIPADRYPAIPGAESYGNAAALQALRAGGLKLFPLSGVRGIVSFPSFHTAAAVLVAVALWPVPRLRWPALALDATMAAATPLFGGHYFVDLVAGGATAALSVAAARALERRPAGGVSLARPGSAAALRPTRGARSDG